MLMIGLNVCLSFSSIKNGRRRHTQDAFTYTTGDYHIKRSTDAYYVTTKCGVTIAYGISSGDVTLRVPKNLYGSAMDGLCGECDGNRVRVTSASMLAFCVYDDSGWPVNV
jgi:hypothetical protein